MAPINTRNHIVLDKESLKRYTASLGGGYTAIFEMDLNEATYETFFFTEERYFIAQSGLREEMLNQAEKQIHPEDLPLFISMFEEKNLRTIVRQGGYDSIEFRCSSAGRDYRWMRILLTPDEMEKDTVLCFISDIDAIKRCEFLEKRNAELTDLIVRLHGTLSESGKKRDQVLNIADYQRQLTEAVLR
ncbi:PAS domain-containing protein [Anaerovorax odorimutans]|uniref:PAS domain-containing protein n=1 Tax=Anaerovorax odorimutans TaxID=109327 RepID=A0ABT1RM30_9FIRM|nr:PAS domain-containing protein [Anaerovorax odorimutans]MCQ4636243.1 PAS domain-containing protein [Anaerovorax odorimutans]